MSTPEQHPASNSEGRKRWLSDREYTIDPTPEPDTCPERGDHCPHDCEGETRCNPPKPDAGDVGVITQRIHVTVEVDTDELRKWADHHADRGHHGVAHVLYKAAGDGESLTEQTIREAVRAERERIAQAIEGAVGYRGPNSTSDYGKGYNSGHQDRAVMDVRIARADRLTDGAS